MCTCVCLFVHMCISVFAHMEKKAAAAKEEETKIKSRFTLPPNVNGRCRGRLSLCLHEIQWSNVGPIQFNWIQAKLLWWGNKYHSAATLKLKCKKNQKKSIGHAIHYNILTKLSLFKKYLLASENLVIKLASGISNIEIGEAVIEIPANLIAFIDKYSAVKLSSSSTPPPPHLLHSIPQTVRKFPIKSPVFDAQQKIIGETLMEFEMVVYDRVCNEMEMEIEREMFTSQNAVENDGISIKPTPPPTTTTKQQYNGIENNMNQFNLDYNKIKLNKMHKNNKSKDKLWMHSHNDIYNVKSMAEERMPLSTTTKQMLSKSTNVSSSSSLLNYLTGRPLRAAEETEAVRAMASMSPTESLIDQLSYDLNGLYLPKTKKPTGAESAEANVLQKIDCMRIHIYDLCLTRAGIREILSKANGPNEMSSFGSGTFAVSIDFDPILSATTKSPFEKKNTTFSSQVTRIFDTSIETIPPAIEFNRSSVHKLNTFCIKSRTAYANGRISLIVQYRDIEASAAQTLGTAQFQLADMIQAANFSFQQQSPITIASSEIICGRVSIKAELGCRGLHFGADFLEAISMDSINTTIRPLLPVTDNNEDCYNCNCGYSIRHCCLPQSHNNSSYEWCPSGLYDGMNDLCAFDIHDEQTEDKSQTPSATAINTDTQSTTQIIGNNVAQKSITGDGAPNDDKEHSLKLNKMDELSSDTEENTLKGLFHVGQINYCSWYQSPAETFLVCRPFWTADMALVTENCQHKMQEDNYQLNYLELFSVICDQKLIDATKHGFMSIEIWQRDSSHKVESLIGSAKVSLHQFYIAFNNNIIRNHVGKQELPVISIDGWITVAYAALPDSTPVGTVQAILAVGTTKQINHLKKSKSLLSCNSFLRFPLALYESQVNHHIGAAEITSAITSKTAANSTKNTKPSSNGFNGDGGERHSNLTSMFSTFIDNLAARLPDRNLTNIDCTETTVTNDATTQTSTALISDASNSKSINSGSGKYMRPTSELLDDLQRALAIAPTAGQKKGYGLAPIPINEQQSTTNDAIQQQSKTDTILPPKMFRVHIEIENALHLPTFAIPLNKKGAKRNRNHINAEQNKSNVGGCGGGSNAGSTPIEMEPNTYVTFDAAATNVLSSSTTYTTNIIETSCSPRWNKQFEVYLPSEYLQREEKRFEIRVWRKVGDNTSKMRLIPNPSNDVTIGLASVDLSVLIAGLPFISGWFNIIDHSGCINGQLKIHIKSKDNLAIYQKEPASKTSSVSDSSRSGTETAAAAVTAETTTAINNSPNNLMMNQISSNCVVPPVSAKAATAATTVDDSALSRALKRKFTELEEITQRLRARLFDVTGNMAIDPDEQFENDLNTIPDEGDDDFEESNMASEMSLDWLEHCHNQATAAVTATETQAGQTTAFRVNNDHDNTLSTAQMHDIFEYLSTTDSNPSRPSLDSTAVEEHSIQEQRVDSFSEKLSSRFNEIITNENRAWSETLSVDHNIENSVENIAESLQKSLIDD